MPCSLLALCMRLLLLCMRMHAAHGSMVQANIRCYTCMLLHLSSDTCMWCSIPSPSASMHQCTGVLHTLLHQVRIFT